MDKTAVAALAKEVQLSHSYDPTLNKRIAKALDCSCWDYDNVEHALRLIPAPFTYEIIIRSDRSTVVTLKGWGKSIEMWRSNPAKAVVAAALRALI